MRLASSRSTDGLGILSRLFRSLERPAQHGEGVGVVAVGLAGGASENVHYFPHALVEVKPLLAVGTEAVVLLLELALELRVVGAKVFCGSPVGFELLGQAALARLPKFRAPTGVSSS